QGPKSGPHSKRGAPRSAKRMLKYNRSLSGQPQGETMAPNRKLPSVAAWTRRSQRPQLANMRPCERRTPSRSCYNAGGLPGGCDVEVSDDMRHSFDGHQLRGFGMDARNGRCEIAGSAEF